MAGLGWARAQARACDPEGAVVDEATGTGGDAEARLWWEAVRGSSWIILAQKRVRLVQHEESNASEERKKGTRFASFGRPVVQMDDMDVNIARMRNVMCSWLPRGCAIWHD